MAGVQVANVSRSFGAHKALDDVSIDFADGGFYALLGPSGSGKTTLLRQIAGFDFPDSGRIAIGGESVERVPVEKRRIGMVFQNYALFPNMSVADNIAFGLSVRGEPKATIATEVQRALDLVQLGKLGGRKPHQLSGGQRQRVALARAIVTKPRVLLLDEPLGALDKALRVDMQIELKRIQREIGITTIFVTHDQEEALTMSDRIGILRDGRLVQEGPPEEIYDRPQSEFAATFLGDANIFRGDATGSGIKLPDGTTIAASTGASVPAGAKASCAVRPERIRISTGAAKPDPADANMLTGQVSKRIFAGNNSTYFVERDGQTLKVIVQNTGAERLAEGQPVVLSWSPDSTVLIAAA
ncbi:ABC transporter ATP-binding protein [Mesorhizobium sp. M2E.F.Ca.ET.209.01.1.1]|uniref:ABC transporter ATP-binding protein n=1 Tax=Mesorhizobium sp. M2E.F.Ca.ET.209.01.1.1 TaxID=2500526 RepID=UPI000FDB4247|nr:ABC transporter ATP-binding protein [Mesorhizobium sp. M2E.F.Ca.ET.209.01.1.1]TGS11844.1 ABC transporter ATP-binding protein [Mesorhizobium sp. M2E.F.Ca.ET.209.01.1.1]